jgi:hypothetical protein
MPAVLYTTPLDFEEGQPTNAARDCLATALKEAQIVAG